MSNLYVNNLNPVVTGKAISVSGSVYVSGSEGIQLTGSLRVSASAGEGEVVRFTPSITIGSAVAEDTKLVFDGNAFDFHLGLDDTADDLVIGVGSALGTTTAIAINENAQVSVVDAFAANVAGSFGTLANDATPSVATGNLWKTGGTTTITTFDDGIAGQMITVISAHAVTFDVTSTTLKGGAADIVTAAGDVTVWNYDGTNWYLVQFMDVSADYAAVGDISGVTAGDGLSGGGTSGTVSLAVDLNELTGATIADGDSIVFIDANDSNASRKETLSDLLDVIAGTVGTTGLDRSGATLVVSDLHSVGVNGSANQLLTDDGDGTVSSEANLTFDGTDLAATLDTATFTSANSQDPLLIIKNTTNDANAARLQFVKDKGAAGADGDDVGAIEFISDNSAQEQTSFAKILAEVSESLDGDEAGKLSFFVAESNDSSSQLTAGLILEGEHATDGEVDVTIGAGAASTTTVAGSAVITTDLSVDGVANLDNTDIDGTFTMDGSAFDINATTTCALDNTNTSNGVTINTVTSGGPVSIGHTTSETTVNDNLSVTGDLAVDGTANLDDTDIDGTFTMDGSAFDVNSTTTCAIDNTNTSNGVTINTVTSGGPISIGHSTSETTVNDNLTVTGTTTHSDNVKIIDDKTLTFGTNDDWTIEYDENGNDDLVLTGSDISIESATSTKPVMTIMNTNADANGVKIQLKKLGAGAANDDSIGTIAFHSDNNAGSPEEIIYGNIQCKIGDITDGGEDGKMDFQVMKGGTTTTLISLVGTLGETQINHDLGMKTDGAAMKFGADGEVTLTHVHDTGLLLSDNSGIGVTKLMFGDDACFVQQQADGQLGIDADSIINVTAPTVDIDASTAVTVDTPTATFTSAATANVAAIVIDRNTSGTGAQDAVGLHVDFDRTVAGSGTNAHNDIGINVDVNSASLGTSSVVGLDIDVVGATSGTHTATGIHIDVDSSDTNIGLEINTAGTHIKLVANADTDDFATIAVADTGDLTIATTGDGTRDSTLTLDVEGDCIIDTNQSKFKLLDNGNNHLVIKNSSNNAKIGAGTDAKNIVLEQFDGTQCAMIFDGLAGATISTNLQGHSPGFGHRQASGAVIVDGSDLAVTLSTAESGFMIHCEILSGNTATITLPTGAVGLKYDFFLPEAVNGSGAVVIKTAGAASDNNDDFLAHLHTPGADVTFDSDGDTLTIPANAAAGGIVQLTCVVPGANEKWLAVCHTSVVCTVTNT
jgi:hypothetical protein